MATRISRPQVRHLLSEHPPTAYVPAGGIKKPDDIAQVRHNAMSDLCGKAHAEGSGGVTLGNGKHLSAQRVHTTVTHHGRPKAITETHFYLD